TARAGGKRKLADETDRDAARTLRSAVTKKKLRKKAVPLAQRKWVQATALLIALGCVAGAAFWLTKPAGAEELYRRAKAAVEAKDSDAALETTGRYLARFGDRTDEPTRLVREWNRELRVQRREQQLFNRM